MMQTKPTEELNDLLANTKPDQLDVYYKNNKKYMPEKAFYYYMKDVLGEKGMKMKDVYSFAGVNESFGGKIMRMEKPTRDRNLIIRFCIAGHFNWDETNKALRLHRMPELYSKDPRDACIMSAINSRIFDLYEIDEMLLKHGFERITREE